jgi:flavodoxin I
MTKVLVVYDSMYGNTEKVAQAIAGALAPDAVVEVKRVGDLSPEALQSVDLLVLGSPTQGFRPTKPVGGWMTSVGAAGLKGVRAAAFDTRLDMAKFKSAVLRWFLNAGGYAAPRIAKDLKNAGAVLIVRPEGFLVEDTEGPLKVGELERSAAWAKSLLRAG